ncbi:hypothetical protein ZIOFF_049102 [Zingiber officinale]|uniref:Uncharacterized protein n=1 Tax=Zingiber officinale TaxID=94328 RepID=A0A8J5FQQ9_ZINOF|nr:hypothetical protein ZIOFF_049102 [Zingiber officinale]
MGASSGVLTTLAGTGPFLRSSSSTRSFSFPRSFGAFYRVGTRGPWQKMALRMSPRSDALVDLMEKQSAGASASALKQFKISADQMLSALIAMSRVLGTCRVLMVAAKGGSKEASVKAVAKGAMKPKGAFHQKLPLSPAMSKFLGIPEIALVDAVKKSGSTSKQTNSRECGLSHKSIIFILDEFDLFAQGKQRLLYSLLDAMQTMTSCLVEVPILSAPLVSSWALELPEDGLHDLVQLLSVVFNVMRTGLFWLCLLGVLVAGMLPHFVMKALIQHFMPTDIQIARELENAY